MFSLVRCRFGDLVCSATPRLYGGRSGVDSKVNIESGDAEGVVAGVMCAFDGGEVDRGA